MSDPSLDLFVPSDEGPILIGCVELPRLTSYEEVAEKLKLCWADWRDEVPHSDAEDFVQWLADTHGWVAAQPNYRLELP